MRCVRFEEENKYIPFSDRFRRPASANCCCSSAVCCISFVLLRPAAATPSPAPATPSCSGDLLRRCLLLLRRRLRAPATSCFDAFSCSGDACSFSGVKVKGGGEIEMGERNPKGAVYEMEMRKGGDGDEMVSVYQKP